MKTKEDLFVVEDLFRVGSSESPKLDNVRNRDIEISYSEGRAIVLPNTGGISVFNKINPRLRGIWWRCSAGTPYPGELTIVCDSDRQGLRHYLIQPTYPMELEVYKSKLLEFAEKFERVML